MANEVKFTEDELKKIQNVQDVYNDISIKLGQISVQRIVIDQQLETLDKTEEGLGSEYKTNQKSESELSETLNKKYGTGTLDIKTGIFTPQQ